LRHPGSASFSTPPPYPISRENSRKSFNRKSFNLFNENIFFFKVREASITFLFESPDPGLNTFLAISLFPGGHNIIHRYICIDPVEFDIFHEFLIVHIIGLKERVFTTIEFKGPHVMPSAKAAVEGGRSFHPFPFQVKLYETMVDEKIAANKINKLFCGKMVPDIRKPNS
jgi:hypothetical protein